MSNLEEGDEDYKAPDADDSLILNESQNKATIEPYEDQEELEIDNFKKANLEEAEKHFIRSHIRDEFGN
jgi:hypothetical protein